MSADRIEGALQRIEAAMERIAAARETVSAQARQQAGGSGRVIELVNTHERLREQVAETLRDLDDLIGQLEE
jgi:methyl-accepting chemotaxis protein